MQECSAEKLRERTQELAIQ